MSRPRWHRLLLIRDRMHVSEEAGHLLLGGFVGIIGGLTNWAYHGANQLVQRLTLGAGGDLLDAAEHLVPWQRAITPAAGGLVAGALLFWGVHIARRRGANLLEAVVAGDGRLPLRKGLVNGASSLVSISTGASIGREGLITELSATLASTFGQIARWPPYRLRLLVACGAAAGIAASYKAPIAGAVFAAQIVMGNFSMSLFAPLVAASVVAAIISRGLYGAGQWFVVPDFDFTHLSQLPWFIVLGVLSGVVGAVFLKTLRWGGRRMSASPLPLYLRMALAGLVVGLIGIVYPQVWGNGYGATNQILQVAPGMVFVLGLLLAKFVATSITVSAGAVGGAFTPTMFLGASLGSLFGSILHHQTLGTGLPTGAFAVVGMGSMLAATTHSPLLAILMIFELSLNYSVMPPLMLACVISSIVARKLQSESIYTESLQQKGVELERESPRLGAATELTVGDIMRPPVPPLRANTPFQEIASRFLRSTNNFLPVVDEGQRLLGIVALQDLKEWLNTGQEASGVIAYDVMRPPPHCLLPTQKLADVLPILLASEIRSVPVIATSAGRELIGTVARAEALGLLSEAISFRSATKL